MAVCLVGNYLCAGPSQFCHALLKQHQIKVFVPVTSDGMRTLDVDSFAAVGPIAVLIEINQFDFAFVVGLNAMLDYGCSDFFDCGDFGFPRIGEFVRKHIHWDSAGTYLVIIDTLL